MEPDNLVLDLRTKVTDVLSKQGFLLSDNSFAIKDAERETKRDIHTVAKLERLATHKDFILSNLELAKGYMVEGKDLNVSKIKPVLRIVEPKSQEERLFRWWNLTWWSLPYERAYGRQMRFIVWDEYHNAPMGLIGLQSPILSWSVRDKYLGIGSEKRDYWVNQSLSAQRLGALPPYNYVLGGKLVGSIMTSDTVRYAFEKKYQDTLTVMQGRTLPARLLFITTTGAFGKSSVYSRLKHQNDVVAHFLGMTHGSGTFHIPNDLYEELVGYLTSLGIDTKRGYGAGPSKKMRLISQALKSLGIDNGSRHGVKRAVYLFPFADNLNAVIANDAKPQWYSRSEADIADFWKSRWAIPRAERNDAYKDFSIDGYIEDTLRELY
jgi:hypothetical protein